MFLKKFVEVEDLQSSQTKAMNHIIQFTTLILYIICNIYRAWAIDRACAIGVFQDFNMV